MESTRDGADVVVESNSCVYQGEGRGIDGSLEKATVLLQDLNRDVNLRPWIEVGLNDRLEGRLDVGSKFKGSPALCSRPITPKFQRTP